MVCVIIPYHSQTSLSQSISRTALSRDHRNQSCTRGFRKCTSCAFFSPGILPIPNCLEQLGLSVQNYLLEKGVIACVSLSLVSSTAVVAVHTPYSSSTAVESRLNLQAWSMAAPDAVAVQAPNLLQSSTFIISRRTENTRIRGVNKNRAAIYIYMYVHSKYYLLFDLWCSSVGSLLFLHKQCPRVRCNNKLSPFCFKNWNYRVQEVAYKLYYCIFFLFWFWPCRFDRKRSQWRFRAVLLGIFLSVVERIM
jgi:hypothetical protein